VIYLNKGDYMIYVEDSNKKYEHEIIKHLRSHNHNYVGDRISAQGYFYAFKDDILVGKLYTSLFWDWVSLGNMYYKDLNTLSTLLNKIQYHYDNYVGIKHYTEVKSKENDLIELGLKVAGHTASTPKIPAYTFLKTTEKNFEANCKLKIISSDEKIADYETVKSENTSQSQTTDVYFIALDEDVFAGGIHGIIEDDSMYISRLAVDPNYRDHHIGSQLMAKIEERARALNLYNLTTGTCSFQAKDFYVKQGYQITFTKENDPKGYESYSLEKKL